MISETESNNSVSSYTYDGDGRRVKRTIIGTETRQVYGFGGELLAEYGANDATTNPQKEYGYRNGQLLITAAGQAQQSTENIVWTNAVNVSVSGNSISKTNADNWDAGADSTKSLASGDGYVEMTASETNKDRMFGWTHNETTASYTDLDFAIRPCDNGTIYVFESGANRGVVGSYVAGDKLRVSIESGAVKYYKTSGGTSTLLYTSSVTPAYPLTADAAFYTSGGTVTGAVISGNLSSNDLRWLVTDQLGTPRMIFDKTGSLSAMTRHDYLPFGEELLASTNGRTTTQGYPGSNIDKLRQQFTQKERDIETGLDYFLARYYSSTQARFTSPDEFTGGPIELFAEKTADNPTFYADLTDPQSLNKYQYTYNNPLRFPDPNGHCPECADFVEGVGRGITGSITMGASGTPRADDSLLNRAGQAVGTMLTSVAGRVTFAAGGGATLLTAGTASEVSIPAAAVGVEMVVGSVINGVRIATTPMQRGTKAGGSITEPNAAKTGEITENGVTIRRNPGDHPPPHLHVNGRGPNTRIGQNGNPLRGDPALSRAQRQAVQQQKKEIRKWIKQIMKEHRFNIF